MKRFLGTLLLFAALAAPAAVARPQSRVHDYLTKVTLQVRDYQVLLEQLGGVLSKPPVVNVDPTVDELYMNAGQFDRLARRWRPIAAPRRLIVRHRQMHRAFEIQAEAWRIYAAALFTRHQDELEAASAKVKAMLRTASYFQQRWAAALQGAVIRADLRVPKWLHDMAKVAP
jgi:hypothetical protein